MKTRLFILSLVAVLTVGTAAAQNVPDYRDLVTFGSYLQQHRNTYSAYAAEKEDLLRLSDSRDPAQITAEFQGKLVAITDSYREIYQSKVAAFNAGVGVVQGMLSSEWQEFGGAVGGVLSGMFAESAQRSAEEQAAQERARLTVEFEEKFFALREEVLAEKRGMIDFYLMAAAFQLSEAEEKKYLDLANYLDCECSYIEQNFSLASTSWLSSNCPRPATSKYGAVAAVREPTAEMLLETIERKLSVPNLHFVRAARDFADIGMAKFPGNGEFLFYRIYLSEDPDAFDLMLISELEKLPEYKTKAEALKKYLEKYPYNDGSKVLAHTGTLSSLVPGNPRRLITADQLRRQGYVYPIVRNGKMIYALPDGRQAFEEEYDMATIFRGGYARVCKEGRWGIIDQTGKAILPCLYADVMPQMTAFRNYRDKVTHFSTDYIRYYMYAFDENGYTCVRTITGLYGVFSREGKWIFPPEETYLPIMPLAKDRFIHYISVRGEKYDELAIVNERGEKISQGDIRANLFTALKEQPTNFRVMEGWFRVPLRVNMTQTGKDWTFMDTDGNFVWGDKIYFDEIVDDGFVDGKCKVRTGKGKKQEEFYIDKTGKRID